ncbi:MAG: hypothetical protein LBL81_02340 [Tannerella sp.]|nr:hypothetical protein [Tannerella sp.]
MILLLCLSFPFLALAQQQTDYNKKGDEAFAQKDYSDARLFYSAGVSACDLYSIQQLANIWNVDLSMRNPMHVLMSRCLSCLNEMAAEGDTTAMAQLVVFYSKGIGTAKSDNTAAYWQQRLDELRRPPEPVADEKKKPASIHFFAGYAFSPLTPFGLTFGGTGKRFGLYAQFKTNASFREYDGEFSGAAPSSQGNLLRPLHSQPNRWEISLGLLVNMKRKWTASAALGYYQWNRIEEYAAIDDAGHPLGAYYYYKYVDDSYQGLMAKVNGAYTFLKHFYVAAGLSAYFRPAPLDGKQVIADLNLGLGVVF